MVRFSISLTLNIVLPSSLGKKNATYVIHVLLIVDLENTDNFFPLSFLAPFFPSIS